MIYLFAGDDTKKKTINYEKFIKTLPKGMEVFTISKNDFNEQEIENFYSGNSLFFAKCTIAFLDILEKEEISDFLLKKFLLMADSENNFVFSERKLNKPIVDAFKKARAEINIYELPKEKKEKFDNFLLANAFANKDKLNLWVYYRQAVDKGVGLEELIGVLFWKIKDMILKKNFFKFKEDELKKIANKLSYLLPDARKNGIDAEIVFEKFLLEVF